MRQLIFLMIFEKVLSRENDLLLRSFSQGFKNDARHADAKRVDASLVLSNFWAFFNLIQTK